MFKTLHRWCEGKAGARIVGSVLSVILLGVVRIGRIVLPSHQAVDVALFVNNLAILISAAVLFQVNRSVADQANIGRIIKGTHTLTSLTSQWQNSIICYIPHVHTYDIEHKGALAWVSGISVSQAWLEAQGGKKK